MHCRLGEVLEATGASDPGILGYHFAEAASGSDVHKAVTLCYTAGVNALQRRLFGDAADHLRRAIDLADRAGNLPVAERSRLALAAAGALYRVGDIAEARARSIEAATLSPELGDAEDLTRAAAGFATVIDSTRRRQCSCRTDTVRGEALADDTVVSAAAHAAVLSRSARWLRAAGADSQADERARQALAVANAQRRRRTGCRRSAQPVLVVRGAGDYRDTVRRSHPRRLCRRARQKRGVVAPGEGVADAAALRTGHIEESESEHHAMTELAADVHDPQYVWYGITYRAMRAIVEGRFADAERLIVDGVEAGRGVQARHPARVETFARLDRPRPSRSSKPSCCGGHKAGCTSSVPRWRRCAGRIPPTMAGRPRLR